MIDHPLIGFGTFGDFIDARTTKTEMGEFPLCGIQNPLARCLCIPCPDNGLTLRYCQNANPRIPIPMHLHRILFSSHDYAAVTLHESGMTRSSRQP